MDYFAGLDVSVKETSVCIVDDAGKIVREARVASEPEALLQVLTNTIYRFKRVGLEAGPLSQWLYSVLAEAGLPVICVETRHMRAVLKAVREQLGILHRRLLAIVRDDDVCRRLMTVPGVGPVVALTYRVTVDVPARFRNSKAVGAVFGLTPAKYQSGEIDRTGAISRCGDEMMRMMLYEAAQSMLVRAAKWSWLKAWAMKIARHRGMKKAIVALARRLAVIMHRIWVDGTDFRWTREVAAA
jgi:transposase